MTLSSKKQLTKTYIYHQDPGHGWLAVKLKELIELGLEKQISSFSYQKGKTAYLEEDSDMSLFIKALTDKGIEFKYRSSHLEKTPIRYYSPYLFHEI